MLSAIAREKEISLSLLVDSLDDSWNVYTDQQLLSTVLRNLICNALKFTPPGGQVTISAVHYESKFVEVSVSDTGVGISDSDQAKLLEAGVHHTTIGTRGEIGTGLGLTICQEMVKKLQGKIWMESQVGQGTTVRFTVPVAQDVDILVNSVQSVRHKSITAGNQPYLHLL